MWDERALLDVPRVMGVNQEAETVMPAAGDDDAFVALIAGARGQLRPALLGLVGASEVDDLLADTLAVAWEHRARVLAADNPLGYLFTVARNKARRSRRPELFFPPVDRDATPRVEPGLPAALARLTELQRLAVFLIAGCGWTYREVAELLGISVSSVSTHHDRGLAHLRNDLGAHDD